MTPTPRRFAPPVRVLGSGFILRCWAESDAPLLRAALDASDAHLRAWTPWVVDGREPGLSLDSRLARHAAAFAAGDEWVYGIFDSGATEVLGGCGLYPRVGPGAIEIGYWLAVAHTGRGIATECARMLTLLALAAPSIERVEIRCDPRNEASARVPRRLGFRLGGGAPPDGGETSPSLDIWTITREEFAAQGGAAR